MPGPAGLVVKKGSNVGGDVRARCRSRRDDEVGEVAGARPGFPSGLLATSTCSWCRPIARPGHGVAGVEDGIHQHLLDHADIGVDKRQLGSAVALEGHVFADDAFGDRGQVVNAERRHEVLVEGLLAEGEQLASQGVCVAVPTIWLRRSLAWGVGSVGSRSSSSACPRIMDEAIEIMNQRRRRVGQWPRVSGPGVVGFKRLDAFALGALLERRGRLAVWRCLVDAGDVYRVEESDAEYARKEG